LQAAALSKSITNKRAAKIKATDSIAGCAIRHHSTLLRDTVRGLLPLHDVYITDWTDARMVPLSEGRFHCMITSTTCRNLSAL
jgi:poly(3-hydroxybutyrate) depolymerase